MHWEEYPPDAIVNWPQLIIDIVHPRLINDAQTVVGERFDVNSFIAAILIHMYSYFNK